MKKLMIVAALAAVWTAEAKVAFAPVFGDKMVLQRLKDAAEIFDYSVDYYI